jgi:RNA polymerase-binding transcription factor DksA
MLTQAEVSAFRQRLLALAKRLDRDRAQLKGEALQTTGGEASGSLSDVPLHLADLGSHGFEEEVTLSLLANEEQLIEVINGALTRIEQGTFGRCEACQKGIAKERLQALPYTRHCARCARTIQPEATP